MAASRLGARASRPSLRPWRPPRDPASVLGVRPAASTAEGTGGTPALPGKPSRPRIELLEEALDLRRQLSFGFRFWRRLGFLPRRLVAGVVVRLQSTHQRLQLRLAIRGRVQLSVLAGASATGAERLRNVVVRGRAPGACAPRPRSPHPSARNAADAP